ncbi:splicing factor [Culex quinquefasciatus]|uniref:Splicing factor n=1 Tax=Culex quinquefasciatus TaxID=7176 RepID=B0WH07_CULQU|nr:splicing factor [Culex quinquefasciatus]|eukprot:XP_001847991.1 splicing factor [Culex quinquefasciatus]
MEVEQPVDNGSPMPQRQQNQNQGGGGPGGRGGGGGGGKQFQNNRNRNNRGGGGGGMNRGGGGGRNSFGGGNRGGGGGGGFRQNQDNQDGNGDGDNQQQNQGGFQNRGGGRGGRNRFSGGGGQGGDGDQGFDRRRSGPGEMYFIGEKLRMLQGQLLDIPPIDETDAKFSGRNRLYVGNLTPDVTEEELVELFLPYGEITEVFMNMEKNYAFVRVDFFSNAEKAKRELDGTSRKNRILKIRFAPNATALRVSNLGPFVTNELLYRAFEVFGPVESAKVQVDERGKSTGEGIVEYKNKPSASAALKHCSEKCFFLDSSLRPCFVEPYTYQDNNSDGLSEKLINKKIPEFLKSRQQGPRFADQGSFEHEYGQRWKHMHEMYKQKVEALKRDMVMEEEKLEAQMEFARHEHEIEQLREQLRMREQDKDRKKAEWEMKERFVNESRERLQMQMSDQRMGFQGNNSFNNRNNSFDMMNQGGGGGNRNNSFGGEVRDYGHGGQKRQSRFDNHEMNQMNQQQDQQQGQQQQQQQPQQGLPDQPEQQGPGQEQGPGGPAAEGGMGDAANIVGGNGGGVGGGPVGIEQLLSNAFGGGGGNNNRNNNPWNNGGGNNGGNRGDDFQNKRRRF